MSLLFGLGTFVISKLEQINFSSTFVLEKHLKAYDSLHVLRKNRYESVRSDIIPLSKSKFWKSFESDFFEICEYWYKTPWDYNGVTMRPRKGKIACGYFVATILQELGFKFPRVHLSRQASYGIIKTFSERKYIRYFSKNFKGLVSYLYKNPDGIYLLGLDTHIGFLYKKNREIYIIHAGKPHVQKESIFESNVVQRSKVHVVGRLSNCDKMYKNWFAQKRFKVYS